MFLSPFLYADEVLFGSGLNNTESSFNVAITADRFEQLLAKKGITIFNRIKHSEAAHKVGIELRDTELILFGNPKIGSPLMRCQQSIAIDLPQKALIWKDNNNKVWLSYNDPEYLVKRHHLKGCEKVITKITKVLASLSKQATGP